MKKSILFAMTIILAIFQLSLNTTSSKKEKAPPGTVYIKETKHYVDKDVVTVSGWKEFYWHTKKEYGDSVAALYMPDSNSMISYYGKNIMAQYSFKEAKEFNNLPIVGVSPTQIEQFCVFRSKMVSQLKEYEGLNITYHPIDSVISSRILRIAEISGLKNISSKIPELVNYYDFSSKGEKWQVLVNKDSLINHSKFKEPYGFRCFTLDYGKNKFFQRY